MKTSKSVIVVMLLVVLSVAVQGHGPGMVEIMENLGEIQCGKEAGGKKCPGENCCSQWGYCGTTDNYCGEGCQSQCDYWRCGKDFRGRVCQEDMCCSQYGWCGYSDDYCEEGCQSQCALTSTLPSTLRRAILAMRKLKANLANMPV